MPLGISGKLCIHCHILGVFGGSLFSAMKKSSFHVPLLALLVLIILLNYPNSHDFLVRYVIIFDLTTMCIQISLAPLDYAP